MCDVRHTGACLDLVLDWVLDWVLDRVLDCNSSNVIGGLLARRVMIRIRVSSDVGPSELWHQRRIGPDVTSWNLVCTCAHGWLLACDNLYTWMMYNIIVPSICPFLKISLLEINLQPVTMVLSTLPMTEVHQRSYRWSKVNRTLTPIHIWISLRWYYLYAGWILYILLVTQLCAVLTYCHLHHDSGIRHVCDSSPMVYVEVDMAALRTTLHSIIQRKCCRIDKKNQLTSGEISLETLRLCHQAYFMVRLSSSS